MQVSATPVNIQNVQTQSDNEDNESKAKQFFMKGIEMEKAGKMYEAIQFYRRAVQIVPDIEFKVDIVPKQKSKETFVDHGEDGKYFSHYTILVTCIMIQNLFIIGLSEISKCQEFLPFVL